ncbi:MAG: ribonuclease R [Flavobacteriales bacterium]|nr:ribonuclease R [Flavobacteriales bacterium]
MSKNQSRGVIKKVLKESVIRFFKDAPKKSYNHKQVSGSLGIHDVNQRKIIIEVLFELAENDNIKEVDRGRYKFNHHTSTLYGKLDGTQRGDAYFISDDLEEDVLIKEQDLNQAFDGDFVNIKLKKNKRGSKSTGRVVEIVKRARTEYAGTIQKNQKYAFFVPDNQKISVDFFIDLTKIRGARQGDKVLARMLEWPKGKKNPYGEVTVVLGRPGENEAEIHAILSEYNLPYDFPKQVERAAEVISTDITAQEIKKRRDFREVLTFTIDPDDAKDFDDALSLKRINDDLWEVGVHIADVSHYVEAGSTLDDEAYKRGNSCYLVDRVIPMLPEVLSNGLCSLRPNEEKYTFSAVFEIDGAGNVKKEWFGKTIIYSDRRFTYEEAQERIETGKGDLADEVRFLNDLSQKLRAKRIKAGALEIESEETKFRLDEDGHPVEVYQKISKDANKLIEEFMLLANKQVAAFIGKPEKGKTVVPFVYRIHDKPSEDRLEDLKLYINRFGYRLELEKNKPASFAINKLLRQAKKNGDHAFISPMAIKSMAKAVYSSDNIGHYGLAFQYYSHFTSPIRRYADLLVHRLLFNQLNKQKKADETILASQCKHISETEKQAVQAERASIKFMQVKFMLDKVGEVMPGRITGVTEWGIFVELHDNKCEGLVHIRSMRDDHYVFNYETLQMIGKRNGKSFGLGDDVVVEIKDADLFKKQLDFALVND